jgi:hypothetical protein
LKSRNAAVSCRSLGVLSFPSGAREGAGSEPALVYHAARRRGGRVAARSAGAAGGTVIGFLSSRSSDESAYLIATFRRGLAENGYVDGQNVTIEFRWADGRYDRLPALAAELVQKPVVSPSSLRPLYWLCLVYCRYLRPLDVRPLPIGSVLLSSSLPREPLALRMSGLKGPGSGLLGKAAMAICKGSDRQSFRTCVFMLCPRSGHPGAGTSAVSRAPVAACAASRGYGD